MSIKLEISLSEAIDKLTILDIKRDKIKDDRKKDVENEYNYLLAELNAYVTNYSYYYKILKKTNLEIWELQDIIRSETCDKSNFYTICDEILNLNDSRYLIKKKINEISNSKLKEQKGYKLRILNVRLNCDIATINNLNGAIRYYSFFYDEVVLVSKNENIAYLTQMFNDDPFIISYSMDTYNEGIVSDEKNKNADCIIVNNYDITVKITHSYFNKNVETTVNNPVNDSRNNDDKYSNEVNDIYNKLGIKVSICDEYKNIFSIGN